MDSGPNNPSVGSGAVTVTAVNIRNLVKTFGSLRAVDGLSLEVREGEIYGLLGPNGAGKTTTIRILMGLLKPDSGNVDVYGHNPVEVIIRLCKRERESANIRAIIKTNKCLYSILVSV